MQIYEKDTSSLDDNDQGNVLARQADEKCGVETQAVDAPHTKKSCKILPIIAVGLTLLTTSARVLMCSVS